MENPVLVLAALAMVALALAVITFKRVVYAAFALVALMLCQAFFFLALGSPFLALLQITLYAGAIMVLFLFVIMLLGSESSPSQRRQTAWVGAALAAGGLLATLASLGQRPEGQGKILPGGWAEIQALGHEFLGPSLVLFEMVSLLLLAAMVGVVVFMRGEKG